MGLDICVYRLHKATEEEAKKHEYFRLTNQDEDLDEKSFPNWALSLKRAHTEKWYDWKKYKEQTGINMHDYEWREESYSSKGCFMKISNKQTGKLLTIDLEKVPLYNQPVSIIGREEIGYQRKGLNDKFYEDYKNGKIGYFVWTKEELERYKEEYCDDPYEYIYPNGEKSGKIVSPKKDFQENIIDNFVEGECCVCFSW